MLPYYLQCFAKTALSFKGLEYNCKCFHTCSHAIFIGLGFTKDFNTPL